MKTKTNILMGLVVASLLIFSGCSGGGSDSVTGLTTSLNGVAQKGAFKKDSNVSLCKLDEKMACTSDKLETKVSDDKGSYEFKTLHWSGYSRLTITGYYLDELTGTTSLSPATITAIVDIKSNVKQKSNTNLLTDMRAKRMKELVAKGKTRDEAAAESGEDVKKLFNIKSDDFTALDLVDFSEGRASVNVELLRISAAVANAEDPVATLEELMKIYNDGGLAAVLESSLYKKLMRDTDKVDIKETLAVMRVTSEVINAIPVSDIQINPFVRARMSTQNNNQVILTLFGTTFNTKTPDISLSVEGGLLSIDTKQVLDDNKTLILDMNDTSSCKDINLTFIVEYMSLSGENAIPLQSNKLVFSDPMTLCNDSGNEGSFTPILTPTNKLPVAIIGMDFEDESEQSITAYVGNVVNGLEGSYSHDVDPYPFGGITHCQWQDETGAIIQESNDASCDLNNLVFDVAGVYDYNLTVTDKVGGIDINTAHITIQPVVIPVNHTPIVSFSNQGDNIANVNVAEGFSLSATDEDGELKDLSFYFSYGLVGSDEEPTSTEIFTGLSEAYIFSHTFTAGGDYFVDAYVKDAQSEYVSSRVLMNVIALARPIPIPILQEIEVAKNSSNNPIKLELTYSQGDDVGNHTLVYIVSTAPEHGTLSGSGANITYTPTADYNGSDYFVWGVSEGSALSSTTVVGIEITSSEPTNHAPTVSISPSGDKNINVGESVILKSSASDEDGDVLTISWKLKEQSESTFTSVPLYGATGFNYTFNAVGIYLVVVEVEDGSGAKADANITVNVTEVPAIVMTLDDVNISVVVKGEESEQTNFTSDILPTAEEDAQHGTVEYFKIGNEVPAFRYTSTDCFIGMDSFVYKSGDDYGRVNVTITAPSTLDIANDVSVSIFNTEVISGDYLRANSASIGITITTPTSGGSSSLTIVGNEIVNYNYDPDDTFKGDDYFIYTLSETINSCPYSDDGRVNIEVKAPLPKVHLFNWYDDVHGSEIWRTDGTVEGTVMVKDIREGIDGSGAVSGIVINGIHYFGANDGIHSTELWRSDATESGTVMVKDINPGLNDGSFPYHLSIIGDTFYFFARTGDNNGSNWIGNKGLWKSDGTEAGTLLVEDFGDDSLTSYMGAGYLKAFGNLLIFAQDDGAGGGPQWEPWISDGSSSAFKLKDIRPGDEGSSFIGCLELNSKCYASADDYTHGSELWVTDGTESGTHMVRDIYEDDGSGRGQGSVPSNLTIVGNKLFFIATTSNGFALWKSDGTASGTVMVKDHFSGDGYFDHRSNYGDLVDVGGVLYFVLDDEINGQEIWKSDGTASGTVMVKDIGSDNNSAPSELRNLNGTLYFWFTDNTTDANSGLWKSDGTADGTVIVKAFSADYNKGYGISGSGIQSEDSKLYIELMNYGNSYTKEYWISDGTEVGTFKLVDGQSMGGES